jgi:hypothetical protein
MSPLEYASPMKRLSVVAIATCLSFGGVAFASSPAGAHTKRTYPASIRHNFLSSCDKTSNGAKSACNCLLGYMENHATLTQFLADEDMVRAGITPKIFRRAVDAC